MIKKSLENALYNLGRDKEIRTRLINFLKNSEKSLNYNGSKRDDVIGPIVDALHDEDDVYEKLLSDGTSIKFFFRTQIARDFLLSTSNKPSHVWEPQTTKLLLYLAKNLNDDILIGGAYFGDHAILVAKSINTRGGVVHCFEPNLDQNKMLNENKKINALKNIKINKHGLWSHSDKYLKLTGFDSFANSVLASDSEEAFKTVTIDDYCLAKKKRLGLIQLDIEGSELKALEGAKDTIKSDKPVIVFEIHKDYVDWSNGLKNTPVCKLLLKKGYTIFAIRDFHSHLEMRDKKIELIPLNKVFLKGPPHGFNMVATADIKIFNNKKFKIVENVSPKLLLHKNAKLHHPTDGL